MKTNTKFPLINGNSFNTEMERKNKNWVENSQLKYIAFCSCNYIPYWASRNCLRRTIPATNEKRLCPALTKYLQNTSLLYWKSKRKAWRPIFYVIHKFSVRWAISKKIKKNWFEVHAKYDLYLNDMNQN